MKILFYIGSAVAVLFFTVVILFFPFWILSFLSKMRKRLGWEPEYNPGWHDRSGMDITTEVCIENNKVAFNLHIDSYGIKGTRMRSWFADDGAAVLDFPWKRIGKAELTVVQKGRYYIDGLALFSRQDSTSPDVIICLSTFSKLDVIDSVNYYSKNSKENTKNSDWLIAPPALVDNPFLLLGVQVMTVLVVILTIIKTMLKVMPYFE